MASHNRNRQNVFISARPESERAGKKHRAKEPRSRRTYAHVVTWTRLESAKEAKKRRKKLKEAARDVGEGDGVMGSEGKKGAEREMRLASASAMARRHYGVEIENLGRKRGEPGGEGSEARRVARRLRATLCVIWDSL